MKLKYKLNAMNNIKLHLSKLNCSQYQNNIKYFLMLKNSSYVKYLSLKQLKLVPKFCIINKTLTFVKKLIQSFLFV